MRIAVMGSNASGIVLAVLGASLVLTACGGSPSTRAGGHQQSNSSLGAGASSLPIPTGGASHLQLVKFARCMRSHGVQNFPDPDSHGEFSNYQVDPNSPAFQHADQKCTTYLPARGEQTAAQVAQTDRAFQQLLRFAKCMRSHGVPNFPDPTRPAGGGVMLLIPGVNQSSPAFKSAQRDCSRLPGAPHPP